jgi:protein-tyrosine phosphatase
VTHVLNMAPSTCRAVSYGAGVKSLQIDADDYEGYPIIKKHLGPATRFIDEARECEGRVVVHCFAGQNRSATVCCGYLMQHERCELLQAVTIMTSQRPHILDNASFRLELVRLAEKEGLLGKEPQIRACQRE